MQDLKLFIEVFVILGYNEAVTDMHRIHFTEEQKNNMRKRIEMAVAIICFGILLGLSAGVEDGENFIPEVQASPIEDDVKVTEAEETSIPVEEASEEAVEDAAIEDEATDSVAEEENEYANLAIANVSDYVNVRTEPNTDSNIVGKIYDGAVAQILSVAGDDRDWLQITSGNVEGYIKAEFFIYGDAAAAVAAEYVTVSEEFVYAKTLEEERAEIAAREALEARERAGEQATPEVIGNIEFPATGYASNEELRKAIVDYAMQYLGNKYVHGGSDLVTGTDCSGFTCFIYADFGYSISRTPGGQYSSAGRSIGADEIQPGDIICYSSNGGESCTHVALYIGDGQIIHAANSKKGVVIYEADYSPIIGIKNVID